MESRVLIKRLEAQLSRVMQSDVEWCARRLAGARARLNRGQPVDRIIEQVSERVRASRARVELRESTAPTPNFDGALPIHAHRNQVVEMIRTHPVIVLAGETGSGKTTQLPKMCLDAGRGRRGLIGCTQPRRIAARAMAERVAEELEVSLGGVVGYQVRFREQLNPDSHIKFMTDGILLAEATRDRDLNAYDTLIIDEAHERSLNIDFLLGYLRQLLPRRPDLRLIITSATIDTRRFAEHFDDAPVVEVSGRGFPVEMIYQPPVEASDNEDRDSRGLYRGIAEAVRRLERIDRQGDILVFLSGEREIRDAQKYLRRMNPRHTEILPLYARLTGDEQRKVFHPGPQRRIILATNVAETSLTVPRIRFVIDSGTARISRYAHRSRVQRLPIEPISQASANQRAGRCGRLGPGTCVRLYSEEDFLLRPEFTEPEILRTSLASVILRMRVMELGEVEDFPFVDSPPPRMISDAYQLLFELQAVDEARTPTRLGRSLAQWPLDVRLARIVFAGADRACLSEMLVLAAALSLQDPRERPLDVQASADEAHERFNDPKSDFVTLLKVWAHVRKARRKLSGSQFRRWCRAEFLNIQRVFEWFDLYHQLRQRAKEEGLAFTDAEADYDSIHQALLTGLLSHVGQKDPEDPSYLGARGRRFHIFPGSGVFGRTPKWLVSAEIIETSKPYARINAQLTPDWIERAGEHLLKRQTFEPHWSRSRGEVMAFERVSLFGLVLVERRSVRYAPIDTEDARRIFIREGLVANALDGNYAFVQANQKVCADVEMMEHKRRVRDVLADEDQIAAFFDSKLPPTVCDERSLKAWLKSGGDDAESQMRLHREDVIRPRAGKVAKSDWPDRFSSQGHWLQLRYHFEPGDRADGVSLVVPLDLLNTLDSGALQWLVPGLLLEKITALIKVLPKVLRRSLVPAPHYAEAVAARLGTIGDAPLLESVAQELTRLGGLQIEATDFDESALPVHLRMRVVLLDAEGEFLDESRDVADLQARYGTQARRGFMDRQGANWNRDGARSWDFGDLPESVTTTDGVSAWPALVDQDDSVGLRLFDTLDDALIAHQGGVLKLLMLHCADKLRYLQKNHGISSSSLLAWAPMGSAVNLVADLARSSLAKTAGHSAMLTRSEGAFSQLCTEVRRDLGRGFQSDARLLEQVLRCLVRVQEGLHALAAGKRELVQDDLDGQINDLLYDGFLLDLEPGRLEDYPRYLEALCVRIERLDIDPGRDARLSMQLAPWWQRYQQRLLAGADYDEALDEYRWLIEEYRVSLFAQGLGTRIKTSPKRLEKAWARVLEQQA